MGGSLDAVGAVRFQAQLAKQSLFKQQRKKGRNWRGKSHSLSILALRIVGSYLW